MANSFSRTTRSLNADGHSTTLVGLLIVLFLLVIWGAWFFASGVSIRQSSTSAQVTGPQKVTAIFSSDSAQNMNRGQTVTFHPAGTIGAQNGPIPGIVARVSEDPTGELTYIDIALRFEQNLSAPLPQDLKGRVDIELEQVSPARLILRSAGMVNRVNGKGPSAANN